jgi:lipopolysaccharide cholinephosphotransferase
MNQHVVKSIQRKDVQDHLYCLYAELASILGQRSVKHIAAAGTMLGAVRNGGIIPWDDDIDLYISVKGFQRVSGSGGAGELGYFQAPYKGSPIPYPYLKYKSKNYWAYNELVCDWEQVSIDIFPLELVPKNSVAKGVHIVCVSFLKRIWNYSTNNTTYKIHSSLVDRCLVYLATGAYKALTILSGVFRGQHHNLRGQWIGRECFSVDPFLDVDSKKFGDVTIPVPLVYDAYLTHVYGEYRQPPLKSARVPHSDRYELRS